MIGIVRQRMNMGNNAYSMSSNRGNIEADIRRPTRNPHASGRGRASHPIVGVSAPTRPHRSIQPTVNREDQIAVSMSEIHGSDRASHAIPKMMNTAL